MHLVRAVVSLGAWVVWANAVAGWAVEYDMRGGLFQVSQHSVEVVEASFAFWGADWKWADHTGSTSRLGPGLHRFEGRVPALGLTITSTARGHEDATMTWDFDIASASSLDDVVGGGIAFRLKPSPSAVDSAGDKVEILPDSRGWRLVSSNGAGAVAVEFDPPVAAVNYGVRRGEVRAYFFTKRIEPGNRRIRMTVTLPPGGRVVPTEEERFGESDRDRWFTGALDVGASPVDLSFLNAPEAPAGKRGFLQARGEALVFPDGTPARFWGVNVQAYALYDTSNLGVKRHARRLSQLGFNLVRIHHADSAWVQPNIFGRSPVSTRTLNPEMLDKLDWWIKCLKDEGIYIWLDLHVGRAFRQSDGITNFNEIAKGEREVEGKGFTYINPDVMRLLQEFNEQLLTHLNPYTGLRYMDDPAIVTALITNENDLTFHFGNALLPDKDVPKHNETYMALARRFARNHGLPEQETWRSWEHGPSKLFLNDVEHSFNLQMIRHLRDLGFRAPLVTTNSWGTPLSSLPALTDGEIIDVHSYGAPKDLEANPRYRPNLIHRMAMAQIVGKPLTVSEWNISPFPAANRAAVALYVAAVARLQGWDAVLLYGYSQITLDSAGRPGNWDSFNDPALMGLMPAAALLFRQGHVSEAANTYVLKLDLETFFGSHFDANSSTAIRTIPEQSKLRIALPDVPALPWLRPEEASPGAIPVDDPQRDFIPAGQDFVRSDTRELYRNWRDGIFTIDTPKSQVLAGWIGGKALALTNISAEIKTKNAVVAVQSLEDRPIRESGKLLITLAARSEPAVENKLPFLSEPVEGRLAVKAPAGLSLFAINRFGREERLLTIYRDGAYQVDLDSSAPKFWLVLRAE